ncbi:MAG: 2-amino-4-hydroxy-6-hydroxymethyldihydropteridine diphosphokinase [Kiritimatiellaeota bacterium]|nr:2-amino-4-hydroxy-6-hydroxymethyldihydropteridine diphosphokinase [Kiritimatiellota bacterium]
MEKRKRNLKTGRFVSNFNAKEFVLKSPGGDVYFVRNLLHFARENMVLFENVVNPKMSFDDKAAAVRRHLSCVAPWKTWRKRSRFGWTWHDEPSGASPVRRVILSLGSNIAPRHEWIDKAVQEISTLPDARDVRRSPLYETAPDDVPEAFRDQKFLNGIVTLETRIHPLEILKATQAIEDRLGRTRDGTHGAPRTIDIDVIAIDNVHVQYPDLLVPHPRATARRFVLQPLADLLPDYRLMRQTLTVSELLQQLDAN